MFSEHLLRAEPFRELGIQLMKPTLSLGTHILGRSWPALLACCPNLSPKVGAAWCPRGPPLLSENVHSSGRGLHLSVPLLTAPWGSTQGLAPRRSLVMACCWDSAQRKPGLPRKGAGGPWGRGRGCSPAGAIGAEAVPKLNRPPQARAGACMGREERNGGLPPRFASFSSTSPQSWP